MISKKCATCEAKGGQSQECYGKIVRWLLRPKEKGCLSYRRVSSSIFLLLCRLQELPFCLCTLRKKN